MRTLFEWSCRKFLGVLDAADGICVGPVDTFNIGGIIRDAETERVELAIFVLAPEAGAPAEMAECAVVESVACREREESEGIFTGMVPEAGTTQFASVGIGGKVGHQFFPFLVARDMPAFRCDALVVLVLDFFAHGEVLRYRLLAELGRNVRVHP